MSAFPVDNLCCCSSFAHAALKPRLLFLSDTVRVVLDEQCSSVNTQFLRRFCDYPRRCQPVSTTPLVSKLCSCW